MISLIDAGPGTGKTFSLVYGYLSLKREIYGTLSPTEEQQEIFNFITEEFSPKARVCFFAHSNTNKDTLTARFGKKGPRVMTFHGEGLSCLIKKYGYQKFVRNRTEKHIQSITGYSVSEMSREDKNYWYAIKRILHYLKIEALEPTEENLAYLLVKYADLSSYKIPDDWQVDTEELLSRSQKPDGEVEFADMVYLGKRSLTKPRYDLGFVDESQDVSRSTYQLVTRLCKNVIFCGDKNQAINAFAGASEEMYDSIASKSDAILPLKMTQRCPPHICDLANAIRPGGVTPGPNTLEGDNEKLSISSLPGKLKELNPRSVLILSRTNATIVNTALYLYKKEVPVKIIDKDLGNEILNFFKTFKTKDIKTLHRRVNAYEGCHERSRNPLWVQTVKDKAGVCRSLLNEVSTFKELEELIGRTFQTEKEGFPLTTVHKAKGLEAPNVFILNPPIELPIAMEHPIGREQEINLHFVAVTRSSQNLYWVV